MVRLERNMQKRQRNRNFVLILLFISSLVTYYTFINLDSLINTFSNSEETNMYNIIIDNENFQIDMLIEGHEVYLPLDIVVEYIYPYITLDAEGRYGLLELNKDFFAFTKESIDSFTKDSPITLSFLVKRSNDIAYFPVKSTAYLLGAEVNYFTDRDLLLITSNNSSHITGEVLSNISLFSSLNSSKSISTVPKNSYIKIYDSLENRYKVVTNEGYIGYVNKSNIDTNISVPTTNAVLNETTPSWSPPRRLGLVWDYIKYFNHDRSQQDKLNAVDIISPTWFRMVSEDGFILNSGSTTYAKDAKSKGYKIWGLVTNSFDPDLTSKFLASKDAQNNFIRQILVYSSFYGIDGINIDFENIYYRDKDAFTAFVKLLTEKLHEQNLIVSIDITIPSNSPNWSMVYDRARLGAIVDYVAVMTYDEHWSSSPKSGSVASIGWVERGIQRTLDLIPPEKILLGLPFYTRLWEEELQPNGKVKVSSKAYGMNRILEILEENNAEINWDSSTGQYYSQFQKEGKLYRVWLECQRSLALKASLIEKYDLAGFAAWRKDFEREDVWSTLDSIVKQGVVYDNLIFEN